MIISARIHYAALAMLELSLQRESGCPVTAGGITERQAIPGPFLAQILRALRAAGWVESVRGKQGGYRLIAKPDQVTLLDIAEAVGCQESRNQLESDATAESLMLQRTWERAAAASREVLAGTTLSDLTDQCRRGEGSMFYI